MHVGQEGPPADFDSISDGSVKSTPLGNLLAWGEGGFCICMIVGTLAVGVFGVRLNGISLRRGQRVEDMPRSLGLGYALWYVGEGGGCVLSRWLDYRLSRRSVSWLTLFYRKIKCDALVNGL